MLRAIVENRAVFSFALSCATGIVLLRRYPFPAGDSVLQMVLLAKPWLFHSFRWTYTAMLFSTPLIAFSIVFALLYIFAVKSERTLVRHPVPPYPDPESSDRLFLVIGEVHQPKRPGPVQDPRWLVVPKRGLFTGTAILGAIGTGKTSCCMIPFAEQILSYRAKPDLTLIC